MIQAILQVFTETKKEKWATTTKKLRHVIKQRLTKIYKTFKSFESVKNVHLCHRVRTDSVEDKFVGYR